MSASRTAFAAFVLMLLVFWPAPSHAYTMLHYTQSGVVAYGVPCDYQPGFAHWERTTIDWYHNTAGAGAGKRAALEDALATWTNEPGTDHVLRYAGTTAQGLNGNDGVNTFLWGNTDASLCSTNACHAVTVMTLDTSTQLISDVDIVYNQDMVWRTDGYADSCPQVADGTNLDTQGITVHELGHSLGIGHSDVPGTTMGDQSCNMNGRSLETDDRNALACVQKRYPVSSSYEGYLDNATCEILSGWAWNASRPNDPVYVELKDGSNLQRVVQVVDANLYRGDLAAAGKGNGVHAFSVEPPGDFKDGRWHLIYAQFSGNDGNLGWSPTSLICGLELFPRSMSPASSPATGGTYEVATQFGSTEDGYITELGYYFPYGETGSRTIRLWSDTGTLLASTQISPSPFFYGIGWSYAALPQKYPIQAGVRYRVSVTVHSVHSKSDCGPTVPTSLYYSYTNSPLTAYRSYWSAGNGVFPTTSSCSNLFVSVKFDM